MPIHNFSLISRRKKQKCLNYYTDHTLFQDTKYFTPVRCQSYLTMYKNIQDGRTHNNFA